MGIFAGCLLASDYDATLTNSEGVIPREVREAIKYFTVNGGLFTVCTGRTKQGFHAYSPELVNAPVLLANGAMAYDYKNEKTVMLRGIEADSVDVLQYIVDNFDGIGTELYGADFSSSALAPDERNVSHFQCQDIDFRVIDKVADAVFPLTKVMVSVGKERCKAFCDFLDTIDMGSLKYIPQYGDFIEIISKQTDKGQGLMSLAELYGIPKDRVFAVGDGANDADMLKAAAIGFVPKNGDILAKQAGDIEVKSNDDFAVADTIEKIEMMIRKKGY